MKKLLNCKLLLALCGLVIAFLSMLQEHLIGTTDCAWVLGLFSALCSGAFCEVFEWQVYREGYKWKNVLAWIVGAVLAIGLVLILW